jgi:SAM-dependent methyltransferase
MRTEPADLVLPAKPGEVSNLEFVRNLTPYVAVRHLVAGKTVADVGCGTGHGTWLMASSGAGRVTAVDIDRARIRRVSEMCKGLDNVGAAEMDAQRLSLEAGAFQLATCFEVIEHVPRPDLLLSGIRRILASDGVACLSTPNRRVRLLPLQRPWNREHLREYSLSGFRSALGKHFSSVVILGLHGDLPLEQHFRALWRQNPMRVYLGGAIRPLRALGRRVSGRARGSLGREGGASGPPSAHSALTDMAVPAPDGHVWPFRVGELDPRCLNFFAICGFDGEVVGRAARDAKAAFAG